MYSIKNAFFLHLTSLANLGLRCAFEESNTGQLGRIIPKKLRNILFPNFIGHFATRVQIVRLSSLIVLIHEGYVFMETNLCKIHGSTTK